MPRLQRELVSKTSSRWPTDVEQPATCDRKTIDEVEEKMGNMHQKESDLLGGHERSKYNRGDGDKSLLW